MSSDLSWGRVGGADAGGRRDTPEGDELELSEEGGELENREKLSTEWKEASVAAM
jgi:hypothetical protein